MSQATSGSTDRVPLGILYRCARHPAAIASFWILSLAALVLFGITGPVGRGGRTHGSNVDMKFLFAAGRLWIAGSNPYDLDAFDHEAARIGMSQGNAFAYPPQSAILAIPLAAMPLHLAKSAMTAVNVLAAIALAFVALRLALEHPANATETPTYCSPGTYLPSSWATHSRRTSSGWDRPP